MSLSISVRDRGTPFINAVRRAMSVPEITPFVGASVAESVRQNFLFEDQFPNRLGGERTHYFAQAAEKTDWEQEADDRVVVHIRQVGIALRFFGGTVTAGKGTSCITGEQTKYLTIPATAESYGRRACDFPDLVVLWGRNGPFALARKPSELRSLATQGDKGSRAARGEILYWLKTSVTIQPDDNVLPSREVVAINLNRDLLQYARDVHRVAKEEARSAIFESGMLTGLAGAVEEGGGQFGMGGGDE